MIKIGDKVKITSGSCYDFYKDWAERNKLTNFQDGRTLSVGDVGTVIAIDKHSTTSPNTLYGIRTQAGDYIYGEKSVELVEAVTMNGVDGSGRPLHFTKDMLKHFMRCKTRNGEVYIVTLNQLSGATDALVDKSGWVSFSTPDYDKDRFTDSRYEVVEVYAAPRFNNEMLDEQKFGEILWKYVEPKAEEVKDTGLEQRIAYFQTHIDAVRENLASLEAELNTLKQGK